MTLAERAVWFCNNLTLTDEWIGQRVVLRPWQEEIVRALHAQRDDGKTKIRRSLLLLPRKQAKTQLSAMVSAFHILGTGKQGQTALVAASDREQASHLFNKVVSFIDRDPFLARQCRVLHTTKVVEVPKLGNTLRVLSSDGRRQHGSNPSLIVADEMAQWGPRGRELLTALTTGFGARTEHLTLIISTQANSRDNILYEEYAYACKVRDRIIDDPEYLPVIYQAGEEDDWSDPSVWRKAMPALGDFCSRDYIESFAKRAKDSPAVESEFRQYFLCQLVAGQSKFIADHKWKACGQEAVDPEALKGAACFAGMDLASVEDVTALVLLFLVADGTYHVIPFFWLPRATADKKKAQGDSRWVNWARDGYLTLTEGETTDYSQVEAKVLELATVYDMQKLWCDAYNANHLCNNLVLNGIQVGYLAQTAKGLNSATKYLSKIIIDGSLRHGNHPVLNWMSQNVEVKVDRNENLALCKPSQSEKIDGIVALVDALAAAMSTFSMQEYTTDIAPKA